MSISEAFKYIENYHCSSIVNESDSNYLPIDIDRHKNITVLDVFRYQKCMNDLDIYKNDQIYKVSEFIYL